MKTVPFPPLGRDGYILGIFNVLLTMGLTFLSFQYIQPKDCYRSCSATAMPCPTGGCHIGEQKAGWPLTVFVDDPGGGSPTSGWGLLGYEDPPLYIPLIADVLFYSLLVWLLLYGIQIIQNHALPFKLVGTTLLLNMLLASLLWLFFLGLRSPIGRGHMVGIKMNTPGSTIFVEGFSPRVSISLGEIIEKYGEPDYVRLNPNDLPGTTKTQVALYWDSIKMSVELRPIRSETYVVKKTTDVEIVIFFDEEQYFGLSEIPFGNEKIAWTGYGSYQP